MNKQIILVIMIVSLISLTSAIDIRNITAGETAEPIELGEVPAYYIITNSTPIDVNVTYNGTIALITPSKYMDGIFTITFYNEKDEEIEIEEESYGGGPACYRGYTTTDWSECLDGKHNRTVTKDLKTCHKDKQVLPIEIKDCMIKKDEPFIKDDYSDEMDVAEKQAVKMVFIVFIVAGVLLGLYFLVKFILGKENNRDYEYDIELPQEEKQN